MPALGEQPFLLDKGSDRSAMSKKLKRTLGMSALTDRADSSHHCREAIGGTMQPDGPDLQPRSDSMGSPVAKAAGLADRRQ